MVARGCVPILGSYGYNNSGGILLQYSVVGPGLSDGVEDERRKRQVRLWTKPWVDEYVWCVGTLSCKTMYSIVVGSNKKQTTLLR